MEGGMAGGMEGGRTEEQKKRSVTGKYIEIDMFKDFYFIIFY